MGFVEASRGRKKKKKEVERVDRVACMGVSMWLAVGKRPRVVQIIIIII